MDATNDYQEEDSEYIQTMIKTAIEERNEAILSLVCGKCTESISMKKLLGSWRDNEGNTILHLAAKIAPPAILKSGGALFQMQQDSKWFKKVESVMSKNDRRIINRNQETARDIFTREHKGLIEEAYKHVKSTSSALTIAATLIFIRTYFAVLRSTYNSSTNVFVILALFLAFILSLISAGAFLMISLASCDGAENFLTSFSLPQELVIGTATLIFSLAMIMAAYIAELYSQGNQVGGTELAFAFFLVLVLALSHVKFLMTKMFSSAYGRSGFTSSDRDKLLRVARKNYYEGRWYLLR